MKAQQVDVLREPSEEPIVWFQLNEVELRLLAIGFVGSAVRKRATAAVAWFEDDPSGYVDEDVLRGAS